MDEPFDKINEYVKEHTRFSAPEVQGELHITYRVLTEALKTLQEKGVVKFLGGMSYEYNADLKNDDCCAETQSGGTDGWSFKIPDDDEDDLVKRGAYLEMRRHILLRRLRGEIDDDDDKEKYDAQADGGDGEEAAVEENDAVEDNADDNADDEELDEDGKDEEYDDSDSIFAVGENFESDLSNELFVKIKNKVKRDQFELYRDVVGYTKICAKGLKFCNGATAEFYIFHRGEIIELCDGGTTMQFMLRKPGYGYKRSKNTLAKITEGLMVRMDDREQLRIDVSDLTKLPAMYYYFYWLVESLIS